MKILFLITFFISSLVHAETFLLDQGTMPTFQKKSKGDFSILWWNILHGGTLAQKLKAASPNKIDPMVHNLETIINGANRPDLLVLGEYDIDQVSDELVALLNRSYKYRKYFRYSEEYAHMGLMVLTDKPFFFSTQAMDWVPFSEDKEEYRKDWYKADYVSAHAFTRDLVKLRFKLGEKDFYAYPFHACQPWVSIQRNLGKYLTGASLIFGIDNPLFYQLARFQGAINKYRDVEKDSFVVFGDFNTPNTARGFTPNPYLLMDLKWNEVFEETTYTYPTPSSGEKRESFQIDHAFYSDVVKVKESYMLPFKGSDHFPIYFTVKP